MKNNVIIKALLMGYILSTSMSSLAKSSLDMVFYGTLIEPPPCSINDDERVDVDFGDRLGINKVDGVNYREAIPYQIRCESGETGSSTLKLSLSGSVAMFDDQALSTNKDNLGVRVYQNDQPFMPNSTLTINLANPPRLEAVPVKNSGSTLTEGAFEAWATLRAEYQ
jgi:type 1 fimbria pilin